LGCLLRIGAATGGGVLIYYALMRLLGVEEIGLIRQALKRKVQLSPSSMAQIRSTQE